MPAVWIEASRPPKVPGTNAHAGCMTPLVFIILHISWATFALVIASIVVIAYLSIKGRSLNWLFQKWKCKLRGQKVSARPLHYRRYVLNVTSHSECDISQFRKVN